MLKNKKILLGISGSIAAYKSALLTRLLVKAGAEVKVVMTKAATDFITPLTLSTLSKQEVVINFYDSEGGLWNNHVDLGLWADMVIIAPASANTLAKMANGICDNVLLATYLSAKCPVYVAPAMDLDMWKHPSTQRNIATLKEYGNKIVPVEHGELASGLVGEGRMAEPENIVQFLEAELVQDLIHSGSAPLAGKNFMVSAGPTHEALDPIRFIGNRSSGRMGIAIAEAAYEVGATVTLILGPSNLKPRYEGIQLMPVKSAQDMYEAVMSVFETQDIAVMAAAVADYTPLEVSEVKIKKKEGDMHLELKRTKDILYTIGQSKRKDQLTIGFALETNNELANAQKKLKKKNADFIVLNSLRDKGAGFQHDTNKITILDNDNNIQEFELKSKAAVAKDIVKAITAKINTQ